MTSFKSSIEQALSLLGVDRLVLAIHDQSFPSLPEQEIGRGSPYSPGGRRFLQFISELGFNAIQLGPQGRTSLSNPSPYDSTLFSKNDLSISLHAMRKDKLWAEVVDGSMLESMVQHCPSQSQPRSMQSYEHAWRVQQVALKQLFDNFTSSSELPALMKMYSDWLHRQSDWIMRDALFEALSAEYRTDDWHQWKENDKQLWVNLSARQPDASKRYEDLKTRHADTINHYLFTQFIAHLQHEELRKLAGQHNLRLYADMQIGFSQRDTWALRPLFVPGYLLGAPPSRTNPNGQPWGYPVLDPQLYAETDHQGHSTKGKALSLLIERVTKLLTDFDGIRIDHPHGLVCPWMYKSDDPDALRAVQTGARLFESPDCAGHEALAKYAIARTDQLAGADSGVPRYADGWVRVLDDDQIERYAILIDAIKEQMRQFNRDPRDLVCEVLSSCPFPLQSVLKKNGMGRFRVTQKAQPGNADDVYRSDNAKPPDWIMVGTHDTKPIWLVVEQMSNSDKSAWATYLAQRLEPIPERRKQFGAQLAVDDGKLVEALFADLFVGPARNVSVFFSDLFGVKREYNEPGVISGANWVLSVPNDYEQLYQSRLQTRQALNVPRALMMALHARGLQPPPALVAAAGPSIDSIDN